MPVQFDKVKGVVMVQYQKDDFADRELYLPAMMPVFLRGRHTVAPWNLSSTILDNRRTGRLPSFSMNYDDCRTRAYLPT
jgi:hypothetical protein